MTHPHRTMEYDCKIIHGPCDNPMGCNGCYHSWQQRKVDIRKGLLKGSNNEKTELGIFTRRK